MNSKKKRTWLFICVLLTLKCTFFLFHAICWMAKDTIFHKTPSILFVACYTTRVYETSTYICSLFAVTRLSRILAPTPRVDIKKIELNSSAINPLIHFYSQHIFFPHFPLLSFSFFSHWGQIIDDQRKRRKNVGRISFTTFFQIAIANESGKNNWIR